MVAMMVSGVALIADGDEDDAIEGPDSDLGVGWGNLRKKDDGNENGGHHDR